MRVVALFLLVLLAAAGITVQAEGKNLTDRKGARRGSGACEGGMGLGVAVILLFNFFYRFFNETTDRRKVFPRVSHRRIWHVRFTRGCSVCRMVCPLQVAQYEIGDYMCRETRG